MIKRLVGIFFSVALFCGATGAAAQNVLVVGVPVVGPWNFYQEDGEQLTGVDVDVLRALSRETGYKFEVKPMPAARCLTELKNENIDAIAGVSSSYAKIHGLPYVEEPYVTDVHQLFFQRHDVQTPITKYSHLYSNVLGIIRSFSYFQELDEDALITKEYSEDPQILFDKLYNNELKVVAAAQLEASFYLRTHKLPLHTFVPASVNLTNHSSITDRVIAFSKGTDRAVIKKVQRVMTVLKTDGIIGKIYSYYADNYLNEPKIIPNPDAQEGEGADAKAEAEAEAEAK